MRKKLLLILSLFALMTVFVSCNKDKEPKKEKQNTTTTTDNNNDSDTNSDDNTPKTVVTDKDYFVTEWQGSNEIRIEEIYGENIVSQYKEKETKDWINIVVDNNKLIIKNLSADKIYELRLFNVSSLKIVNTENNKENRTLKLITQWGTTKWKSMNNAFAYCKILDVLSDDKPDLSDCKDCSNMFRFCENLKGNDKFGEWNVSKVTDMNCMFLECKSFNQPIDRWNVSEVMDMNCMFWNAKSFNQPLNNWDVSNVTDMCYMFGGATSFNQPLNDWNVSNVTNTSGMFWNASSFNQPLDKWNVSMVFNMWSMFKNAISFNQSISNWNVENVKDWKSVFQTCPIEEPNKPAKFR